MLGNLGLFAFKHKGLLLLSVILPYRVSKNKYDHNFGQQMVNNRHILFFGHPVGPDKA